MDDIFAVNVLQCPADLGNVVTTLGLHQLRLHNLLKQLSPVQVLCYHHDAFLQVESFKELNDKRISEACKDGNFILDVLLLLRVSVRDLL